MAERGPDGMMPVNYVGFTYDPFTDLYHSVIGMRWVTFIAIITATYFSFNAVFASLYMLGGNCYNATDPGSFLQAFAFSVQTMSGIGYGAMSPTTPYANVVSIIEAFLGLTGIAMTTGLLFAKFSRPMARVGFAQFAVVNEMDGVPTLQVRMSNLRRNQVVDAHIQVAALIDSPTREGHNMRRVMDLPLVRSQTPVFRMSWTVMHRLDENSPLHGLTKENREQRLIGLILNFTGLDDTFSQTVSAQRIYSPQEIRIGYAYCDMIENHPDGSLTMHYDRLHDIQQVS
ncbi:MAG: ion channel [Myxococcota bacterium]